MHELFHPKKHLKGDDCWQKKSRRLSQYIKRLWLLARPLMLHHNHPFLPPYLHAPPSTPLSPDTLYPSLILITTTYTHSRSPISNPIWTIETPLQNKKTKEGIVKSYTIIIFFHLKTAKVINFKLHLIELYYHETLFEIKMIIPKLKLYKPWASMNKIYLELILLF